MRSWIKVHYSVKHPLLLPLWATTYPGVAAFTEDLLNALCAEALNIKWWAKVMDDVPEGDPYPPQVQFEIDYKKQSDDRSRPREQTETSIQ